jgi:hypothetical protein
MSLVPPANVATAAAKGLEMRAEFGRGGTMVGVARAKQLKNRQELSPKTVKRMVSFFARHEVDKQGKGFYAGDEGYPSAGRIAWELWGGDAGKTWAEKTARSMERKEEGASAMTDVRVLKGSAVRRIDGKLGTIKSVSLPWVTVEWTSGKEQSFLRSDDSLREDIEVKTLNDGWVALGSLVGVQEESEGDETDDLIDSLRDMASNLVAEVKLKKASAETKAKTASASSKRRAGAKKGAKKAAGKKKAAGGSKKKGYEPSGGGNPYSNRDNRGDKPEDVPAYGGKSNKFFGDGPTEMPQAGKWSCKNTGPYRAKCVSSEGEVKIVNIKKSYKKKYNKAYASAEADGATNSVRGIANRSKKKK